MAVRERLTASVADIRTRAQRLLELNRELLTSEMKEKGRKAGGVAVFIAGAGFIAVYAVGFALATIAVALALVLPLWLSLLIVTAVLFLAVLILGLVGRSLAARRSSTDPSRPGARPRRPPSWSGRTCGRRWTARATRWRERRPARKRGDHE